MTQKKENQREERERKKKVIKGKIKEGHQRGRENTSNKVIENKLKVSVIKRHLLTLTQPMKLLLHLQLVLVYQVLLATIVFYCFQYSGRFFIIDKKNCVPYWRKIDPIYSISFQEL